MNGKKWIIVVIFLLLVAAPEFLQGKPGEKELVIVWRRLVDQKNQTCPRCYETGSEVETAVKKLRKALAHVGVVVIFRSEKITPEEFSRAPMTSNVITIQGKSVEDWIGGSVGQSPCCDACGDNDCRTVRIDGKVYEAVPEELILKAALLAAASLW